jgi:hypothetical protein
MAVLRSAIKRLSDELAEGCFVPDCSDPRVKLAANDRCREPRAAPIHTPLSLRAGYNGNQRDATLMTDQSTREWIHSLSSVLGALIEAGMSLTMFREHAVLPWLGLPIMVPATERMWRLPDGFPRMPLSFSLRARKVN